VGLAIEEGSPTAMLSKGDEFEVEGNKVRFAGNTLVVNPYWVKLIQQQMWVERIDEPPTRPSAWNRLTEDEGC
jgi:hypothetical protein